LESSTTDMVVHTPCPHSLDLLVSYSSTLFGLAALHITLVGRLRCMAVIEAALLSER
jgi:hypothetical protein